MRLLPRVYKSSQVVVEEQAKVTIDNRVALPRPASGPGSLPAAEQECQALFQKAQEEAEEILVKARQDAEALLLLAQRQVEDQTRQAQIAARQEGYAQGFADAQEQVREVVGQLQTVLTRIDQQKRDLFRQYEKDLVELVLDIARKVILAEMDAGSDAFLYLMMQAAKDFRNEASIKVQVSDFDISSEFVADEGFVKTVFAGIDRVEVEVIKAAPRGTCIIESPTKVVDASLETQLSNMREQLLDTLE